MRTKMAALYDAAKSTRAADLPGGKGSKDFINSILPPELLSKIFEIGADMEETDDDFEDEEGSTDSDADSDVDKDDESDDESESDSSYDFDSLAFASLVSQICSAWRKVALSTPAIWRHLYVVDETPVEMITTWLDRSKAVPLDIDISLDHKEGLTVQDLMPLLIVHVSRWRSFDCHTAVAEQMPQVMAYLLGKEAPMLEVLVLNDQEEEDLEHVTYNYPVHSIFAGPASLPKLKVLALWTSPVIWASHPFSNLVELELCYIVQGTRPSLQQFIALLQSSPKLEKLLMSGDVVDLADFENLGQAPDPIVLDSLRALTITEFETPIGINHIIRLLNPPNLVELSITDLCFDREGDPVDFTPTFNLLSSGVFLKVETLQIAYVTCADPESLERWFCNLKELRKLHLIVPRPPTEEREGRTGAGTSVANADPDLAFHFLRAFVPPKMRPPLGLPALPVNLVCPLLEELTTSGVPDKILVMFAEARKSQEVPLASIVHDGRDEISSKSRDRLEELGVELEEYEETEYGVESEDDEDDEYVDGGLLQNFTIHFGL
ncbi:hypothetical protein FRB95_007157 [Tulasnella sp. JGI-2019a]|nr:hypothetical protein FRB95_007157 [Tulasnella sp. JGI-2019a]